MKDAAEFVNNIEELIASAVSRVRRGAELSPRLLDIDDAGRYLGMSDKGVRELIQSGELPFIQRVRSRSPYLLDVRDLDTWVAQNKTRAGK